MDGDGLLLRIDDPDDARARSEVVRDLAADRARALAGREYLHGQIGRTGEILPAVLEGPQPILRHEGHIRSADGVR